MSRATSTPEYQALAQFRFLIRRYLNNSEKAARSVGLEPQQYMGLLALRGLPSEQEPTIRALAERLQIQHHSAVELVDRMEKRGLFRRERSTARPPSGARARNAARRKTAQPAGAASHRRTASELHRSWRARCRLCLLQLRGAGKRRQKSGAATGSRKNRPSR